MSFLADLESELTKAGIPARRRARIVAEFTDHLSQDPAADLGEPEALAQQFADELGTRLARVTAYRAFAVLAVAGIALLVTFFDGGRTWGGWVGYGSHPASGFMPGWWVPLMVLWFVTAQVAPRIWSAGVAPCVAAATRASDQGRGRCGHQPPCRARAAFRCVHDAAAAGH